MCNCISDFEKRVVEEQPFEKMKVTKAKILNKAFFFKESSYRLTGEFEIEVEGRKRPVKQNLVFSNCPICGEEYK